MKKTFYHQIKKSKRKIIFKNSITFEERLYLKKMFLSLFSGLSLINAII